MIHFVETAMLVLIVELAGVLLTAFVLRLIYNLKTGRSGKSR